MTELRENGYVTYDQDEQGHKYERMAMMTDCRNELNRTFDRIAQWGGPRHRVPENLEGWFVECGVKV